MNLICFFFRVVCLNLLCKIACSLLYEHLEHQLFFFEKKEHLAILRGGFHSPIGVEETAGRWLGRSWATSSWLLGERRGRASLGLSGSAVLCVSWRVGRPNENPMWAFPLGVSIHSLRSADVHRFYLNPRQPQKETEHY